MKLLLSVFSLFLFAFSLAPAAVCNCAVCPERENDFVWENDKFGMRAYGPGEYHKWSGFDVFNKNTSSNVCLGWCHRIDKSINFHQNYGYGMDNYTMGASRGVGGVAMFADGEWKTYPDWEESRVLHTGDDYLQFELVYPAFSSAGRMTCRITLRRGERFFRNDVRFERKPPPGTFVGPGLDLEPKRDHKGNLREEPGLVSLFEDPKGKDGAEGSTMEAVFVADPSAVTNLTDRMNCRVLAFRDAREFTYWAGASWSLAGEITTAAAWHAAVKAARDAVRTVGGDHRAPRAEQQARLLADWPAGKDPKTVSRLVTEQFLSSDPLAYKPVGTDIAQYFKDGYGWGSMIFYATASLWANALDNARRFGEADLERKLVAKFEPILAKSETLLKPQFHVDYNVVGAVPLVVARLTGNEKARAVGLKLADFQWSEPKDAKQILSNYATLEESRDWWKKGYSGETRFWIDDMYMINLLQTEAYRLTGDRKYVDRAAEEMCLYLERLQLENGLFYHAPDVPFVWGRGAGWMAAGMPLVLKCLPKDHPRHATILAGYRRMMASLLRFQRSDGLWGQLVDEPTSWGETSGSAMFAYAFAEGIANGWLDCASYAPATRKAYLALCDRLDAYGNISDVCIGTNKKNDHDYYLARGRIRGDPHGQAPMLWLTGALASFGAAPVEKSYLDLVEVAVGAYDDARMTAYVREAETAGVQEHGFPRLAANLAQLVAAGRMVGKKPMLARMMTVACACAKKGKMPPKSGGNEFSVRELVSAVIALEKAGTFPTEKIAAWKRDLAAVDAYRCYTSPSWHKLGEPVGRNWPLFGAASEQARIHYGLGGDRKFIEDWVSDQLRHFDENGMYRDPHEPAVYDFIGRLCYMQILHFGYDGPSRAKIEENLVKSAEPTLAMLSVCGEIPYGGRSNQFLHNNTLYAAVAEWYAAFFAKRGDTEKAAEFRAAARRAVDALEPWVEDGKVFHVKNRHPKPEAKGARNMEQKWFGCENYAYFDKYMVTMGSWAALAEEFANHSIIQTFNHSNIPPFSTSDHFHWKFTHSRNYTVQEDWNANAQYDATGIGRIHRRGAPPAICLSAPFAEKPNYFIGAEKNPGPLAIAATGGKMSYVVGDDGVTIRVEGNGNTPTTKSGAVLALPVFEFDGEEETAVVVSPKVVTVAYRGWVCRYEARGGTFAETGLRYLNRNGRYRRIDCTGRAFEVAVTIERENRGSRTRGVVAERAGDVRTAMKKGAGAGGSDAVGKVSGK